MANKTFQIKLTPKYQRQMDYLILTHRIFNESLVYVMRKIKDMAKQEPNHPLRVIYNDMMKVNLQDEMDNLQKQRDAEQNPEKQQELDNQIKKLKNKRAQGAQDAGRWMDKITNPNAKGIKKDKQVAESAKQAIKDLQGNLLFDRRTVFPYQGTDYNFRTMLGPRGARRILNNEANEINHKKLLDEANKDKKTWEKRLMATHWDKEDKKWVYDNDVAESRKPIQGNNKWKAFEKVRPIFENEWQKCERQPNHNKDKCYCICHRDKTKTCDQYIIDGATIRGWYKHKHKDGIYDLLKAEPDCPNITKDRVIQIIDKYQDENKKGIGDINFIKWLADRPELWDWVGTMRTYNSHKFIIGKLSRPIGFTYPLWDKRSEWLEYSITSPMPKSFEMDLPRKEITLLVFVPNEDIPTLRQSKLLIEDRVTKKSASNTAVNLSDRIDFSKYQRPKDEGLFEYQPRLNLSKFTLCKVRYGFSPDQRLERRIKPDSFQYDSETKTLKDGKTRTSKTKYPTCQYEYSP
ncbi:MAG: hypothetical protein AB1599_09230, partial [Planctomycetota bacterium]